MTRVPLPDTPCVRVRLDYLESDSGKAGNRFYLSYAGSAPTGANCVTLATDIAAAWATDIAPLMTAEWALQEVDVLDIASETGLSGSWSGTNGGTRGGTGLPYQCASNIEYDITQRYRGGKPRIFLPPGATADLADPGHYSTGFVASLNSGFGAFMTAVQALSVGAMGALTHVDLSYFQGFTNITNSSGRTRAVPTYRDTALHRNVVGYSAKSTVGSQKRRRSSTTY